MTIDRPDYDAQKAADTLRDLCGTDHPSHIRLEAARTILDFSYPPDTASPTRPVIEDNE